MISTLPWSLEKTDMTSDGKRELQSRLPTTTTITQDSNNSHSTAVCGGHLFVILGVSNSSTLYTGIILLTSVSRGSVSRGDLKCHSWLLLDVVALFVSELALSCGCHCHHGHWLGSEQDWARAAAGSQQLFSCTVVTIFYASSIILCTDPGLDQGQVSMNLSDSGSE